MKDFINDKLTNDTVLSVYPYNEESIQELLIRFYTEIKNTTEISNMALNFLEWLVEKGVRDEVIAELNKMYDDGRLEALVNIDKYNTLDNKFTNEITNVNTSISNLSTELSNNVDTLNTTIDDLENSINNEITLIDNTKLDIEDFLNNPKQYLLTVSDLPGVTEKFTQGTKISADNRILDYNSMINNYFNTLVDNRYVSKVGLGIDSSGDHIVNKYILKPDFPKYKMLIVAGVHGYEYVFTHTLFNFMEMIASNNVAKYGVLQELRESVEFHIIPIANPHGWNAGTRLNYNRVDINRNFDYNWDISTDEFKGSAPFSEVESTYIKNEMENGTFDFFFDLHNTGEFAQDFYFAYDSTSEVANIPRHLSSILNKKKIMEYGSSKGVLLDGVMVSPTSLGYWCKVIGSPGLTLEWVNSYLGSNDITKWYNNIHMTKSYELFINGIYKAYEFVKDIQTKQQPIVKQINMVGGPSIFIENTTTFQKVQVTDYEIQAPYDCVATFTGGVTLVKDDNTITQVMTTLTGDTSNNASFTNELYSDTVGRVTIPSYSTFAFNKGDRIKLSLFIQATGKASLYRYRGILELKPNSQRELITRTL